MILLDTHALIWFVDNPNLLSTRARHEINKAYDLKKVYISQISYWEISMLVLKERLAFKLELKEWLNSIERMPQFTSIGITPSIASINTKLSTDFHGDPADRIIAATAIDLDIPIVTKDKMISKYQFVKAIW
ncbi:MAG: type II toxin-antitoxin system VapC family toxin [Candidatus Anammoxibacter sp.]